MFEHPDVRATFNKYHDKGFEIVAVSRDRSKEELRKYLGENASPWIQIHDEDNSICKAHNVVGFPTMILVDELGRVVCVNARGEILDTYLHAMLGAGEDAKKARLARGPQPEASSDEKDEPKPAKAPGKNNPKKSGGKSKP
ncbi:MAG: redoxin domain-containing protein [Planctomycetaceae bacterium]|nr:redoxin domain-containing protein [Planctomycetaceae bacterium]